MCFSAHIAESEIQLHSTGFFHSFNVQCAIQQHSVQACKTFGHSAPQLIKVTLQSTRSILVTECRVEKNAAHILAFHRPTSPDP